MSGLGPAACWLAHKRLESWSRIAKERVSAVRKVALDHVYDDGASTSAAASTAVSLPSVPLTPPPSASSVTSNSTSGIESGASCDLTTDSEEISVMKEIQSINQRLTCTTNAEVLRSQNEGLHIPLPLQHQSRSFREQRTSSVSSQSSVESAQSRQSTHRGSSPQIRTFGPDGRSSSHAESRFPRHLSRSPSPLRTISLDARCASPVFSELIELRTPSSSQFISSPSSSKKGAIGGRSLSPLLIPPRSQLNVDPVVGPASPLGTLQPDLYKQPVGPIDLKAAEGSSSLGRVHLRLSYDLNIFDLTVHLIEAHNLCPIEQGGFRDPFFRLLLEPEIDDRKRQTTIYHGQSNPYIDLHFKFPVSRDQLSGRELLIQVLDYDRYSHNDIVGELRINIEDYDIADSIEIWGDLIRTRRVTIDRPQLLVSLNYLPQAERLTLVVIKAKNLDLVHEPYGKVRDPCVKIYFIVNGKRIKKKKTSTNRGEDMANPVWNEAFTFNLTQANLQNAAIELYVVNRGSDCVELGSCGLGVKEQGTGCQQWHDMMNHTRKPSALWHVIR